MCATCDSLHVQAAQNSTVCPPPSALDRITPRFFSSVVQAVIRRRVFLQKGKAPRHGFPGSGLVFLSLVVFLPWLRIVEMPGLCLDTVFGPSLILASPPPTAPASTEPIRRPSFISRPLGILFTLLGHKVALKLRRMARMMVSGAWVFQLRTCVRGSIDNNIRHGWVSPDHGRGTEQ